VKSPLLHGGQVAYEAAEGAHALAIATEWDEFKTLDFAKIYAAMSKPAFVFDGRNILDLQKLKDLGFRASRASASRLLEAEGGAVDPRHALRDRAERLPGDRVRPAAEFPDRDLGPPGAPR
jgi:hypothetical protein